MKARKFSTAGRVNGIVFDDRNGDGTYNGLADAYLAGWTVYADLDGDGTLDGNEPRAVSTNVTPDFFNHPPNYRLRGVPFGTPAALRLVPPGGATGWVPSGPAPVVSVAANASQSTASQSLGAYRQARVSGSAFWDVNNNGARDAGPEPLLSGRTVYLDRNGNGAMDNTAAQTFNSADVPRPIASPTVGGPATRVTSTVAASGLAALADDVNVRLDVTYSGAIIPASGLSATLISPSGTRVELFQGSRGNLTGTTFDDEAATAYTSGSPPFTGSFRPRQPLSAFDGEDPNGNWTLELTNVALQSGTLNSWSVEITSHAERRVVTDAQVITRSAACGRGPTPSGRCCPPAGRRRRRPAAAILSRWSAARTRPAATSAALPPPFPRRRRSRSPTPRRRRGSRSA